MATERAIQSFSYPLTLTIMMCVIILLNGFYFYCVQISGEDTQSVCSLEEGVMFTCQLPATPDPKKQPPLIMYWVIG